MRSKDEYQRHESDTNVCFVCGDARRGVGYFPHRDIETPGDNKHVNLCNTHLTMSYNQRHSIVSIEEFATYAKGRGTRKRSSGKSSISDHEEYCYEDIPNADYQTCMYCEEKPAVSMDVVPSIKDLEGDVAMLPRHLVPCCNTCKRKMNNVILTAHTYELRKEFILGYVGPKVKPGSVVEPTVHRYEKKYRV